MRRPLFSTQSLASRTSPAPAISPVRVGRLCCIMGACAELSLSTESKKQMKTKIAAILFSAALILPVTGCSEKKPETPAAESTDADGSGTTPATEEEGSGTTE